jgi:hypothetical protein
MGRPRFFPLPEPDPDGAFWTADNVIWRSSAGSRSLIRPALGLLFVERRRATSSTSSPRPVVGEPPPQPGDVGVV